MNSWDDQIFKIKASENKLLEKAQSPKIEKLRSKRKHELNRTQTIQT